MREVALYRALVLIVLALLALKFFVAIRFLLSGVLTFALVGFLVYLAWRELKLWRS